MLNFTQLNEYLISKGLESSKPFDNDLVAYGPDENRVAYVGENSKPLRISLRCRKELGKHLVAKFESVMPGHKLDPKKWITILVTGQLNEQEIFDLVNQAIETSSSVN